MSTISVGLRNRRSKVKGQRFESFLARFLARRLPWAFIDAGRRKEISRTGATVTTAIAASAVAAGAITYANLPSGSKDTV